MNANTTVKNPYGSVKEYLSSISKYKLLTAAEEQELATKMKLGDNKAKETLINSNLRLVVSTAKKYLNRGVEFADLIQEGNLGLIHAVNMFDCEKGYKFSTYASYWIMQYVSRAVNDKSRIIKLPVYMQELIKKVNRYMNDYNVENNFYPSNAEIAKAVGTTEETVGKIKAYYINDATSFDNFVSDDEKTYETFLANNDYDNMTRSVDNIALKDALNVVLKSLSEQERKVIAMEFGLNGYKECSIEEIMDACGVKKERVKQIELNAITKLRSLKNIRTLSEFI